MKFAYFLLGILAINSAYANNNRAVNGVLPKDLEGKKYRVFKQLATIDAMDKLHDGQEITLSQVETHPKFDLFLFYALDDNGNRIFDKKYTLRDLGLIDKRFYSISTKINDKIVKQNTGDIIHGNQTPVEKTFDGKYEPVIVFLSTIDNKGKIAARQISTNLFENSNYQYIDYGISFSCNAEKQVVMKVQWDYPFYMPNSINVSLHFPYKVTFKLNGDFQLMPDRNRFYAYSFTVTPEIEKYLLHSEAGALTIPLHQWSTARYTWTSNGLPEAYSRVKYFCQR